MFLKKFDANTLGRDFVVGDIHGCFSKLCSTLDALGFDVKKDRLFSVGDLVDRGPSSHEAIDWIAQPWFHAVRGNHEQMAIGVASGHHNMGNYLANGGGWFLMLDEDRQQLIAKAFDALPFAIEIAGRVGIVHAEVPDNDWNRIRFLDERWPQMSKNKQRDVTEQLMWAREKIATRNDAVVRNIDRVFVGHTPVSMPVRLGNVQYIDTGAVFGRDFTVCQL